MNLHILINKGKLAMIDNDFVELDANQVKRIQDDFEALKRLLENQDFKRLFTEGFFFFFVARATGLLADPNFTQDPSRVTWIHDQLKASAFTQAYLRSITSQYQMILRAKQEQDELDQEEAE